MTSVRVALIQLRTPANQAAIAHTPWGAIGLTICYDMRFPHLYRALAKAGAQMTAIPALVNDRVFSGP